MTNITNQGSTSAGSDTDPDLVIIDGRHDRDLLRIIALGALHTGVAYLRQRLGPPAAATSEPTPTDPDREVMTADEVAAFLGVDRNTVYDYAGRGVIPHQRLGKRILFRRGALRSWLDSCRATSTRKG